MICIKTEKGWVPLYTVGDPPQSVEQEDKLGFSPGWDKSAAYEGPGSDQPWCKENLWLTGNG